MKNILLFILLLALIYSCTDEDKLGQMPLDTVAPGVVTNVQVENFSGGAKLTYDLPDDDDLLYVIARYQVNEIKSREAITSFYHDEITIGGFGEVKEYKVTLQAVDKSKNFSDPVTVSVFPTTPPLTLAMESLKIIADFGGVSLTWNNDSESDLNVVIMVNDTLQESRYVTEDILYTSQKEGVHSVRGFPAEERDFAVVMVDRFDNSTDTMKITLTPLFEQELDPYLIKYLQALTPTKPLGGYAPEKLWDGLISGGGVYISEWPSPYSLKDGLLYFTLDLGKKVKMSRLVYWQRYNEAFLYNHFNVKEFELWGSNDPAPDAFSFDGWTKIMSHTFTKPSGLPLGELNDEDWDQAQRGHEAIVPLESEAYRYIRFNVKDTWTGGSLIQVGELKFFGKYED